MTPQTTILLSVFIYFGIGGFFAAALTVVSVGFAGRFDPLAILVFFAWPFLILARIPYAPFVIGALVAAAVPTAIMWFVLRALS